MVNGNEIANNYLKLGYLTSTLRKTSIDTDSGLVKKINDISLNNTLNDTLNDTLNGTIKEMGSNNEAKMNVIEAKISENLERVKTSIEKLTQSSSKSVLKGNLGENFVSMVIKNNFPDFTLVDTSKVAGASDYHLVMQMGIFL